LIEKGRTLGKTYGIKARALLGTPLGKHIGNFGNMKCDMDAYVASKGNSKVGGAKVVNSVGQIWHFRPIHRICIGHILFKK
jgi:hypothetical protein